MCWFAVLSVLLVASSRFSYGVLFHVDLLDGTRFVRGQYRYLFLLLYPIFLHASCLVVRGAVSVGCVSRSCLVSTLLVSFIFVRFISITSIICSDYSFLVVKGYRL